VALAEVVQEAEVLLVDAELVGVRLEDEVGLEIVVEAGEVQDLSQVEGEDREEALAQEAVASEEEDERIFSLHAFQGVW
jgi:hypothetical protein